MRRLLLLALFGLFVGGCSSGEVFTFAEADLCAWVSEDDVASFVSAAYEKSGVEWDGTAVAVPPRESAWDLSGDYCQWEPTGGGYVIARGLASASFGRGSGIAVSGYPEFDDNIIVGNAGFARYGFWVEGSDEVLGIEVSLPVGQPPPPRLSLPGSDTTASDEYWAPQETMLFSVANSFLDTMGWTS